MFESLKHASASLCQIPGYGGSRHSGSPYDVSSVRLRELPHALDTIEHIPAFGVLKGENKLLVRTIYVVPKEGDLNSNAMKLRG